MDVLHAAVLQVVTRAQPEIAGHRLIPSTRDVPHRQVTGDQGLLELKAQHDVKRIGDFIRTHADIVAPHPNRVLVQILCAPCPIVAVDAQLLADDRRSECHELAAAPHLHFYEQRLTLMNRRTERPANGLVPPIGWQPLLV